MFRGILLYFYSMFLTAKRNLFGEQDISEIILLKLVGQIQQGLALEDMNKLTPEVKIHELRKSVKRCRSMLRVLKSRMPDSNYYEIDELLGSTARNVSHQRETSVNLRTFMDLCLNNNSHLSPQTVNQIRNHLANEIFEAYSDKNNYLAEIMETTFKLLFKAHFQLNGQPLNSFSAKDLNTFIDKTYRKSKNLFKASYHSSDTEIIHKWRRYAKHLLFQLKFTPHSFQYEGSDYFRQLESVSDKLGVDHDLAVLEEFIEKNISINTEDLKQIKLAIMKVRSVMQKKAFEIGNQLFSKKSIQDYLYPSTSKTLV